MTTKFSSARTKIDDIVSGADRFFVVLDHQHGVAEVAQPPERVEQPAVVALMQADRGLVQDIEDADQARSDLRGETYALSFSARQRAGGPVQGQVVEADVGEEAQALADLLQHAPRDGRLPLAELERAEEAPRVLDGEAHDVRDRLAGELQPERLRAQARAAARRTRALGHERLDLAARVLGLRLAVAALEHLHHALEAAVAVARQDDVAHGLLELGPRLVERELVALGQGGQRLLEVGVLAPRPRRQGAGPQRAVGVRHQPLGIDLEARADAAALRAGAVGVVEREHARRHLGERDAALRAGEALGENHGLGGWEVVRARTAPPRPPRSRGGATSVTIARRHWFDLHDAVGQAERGFQRVGQARAEPVLDDEAIDDDVDRVLALLVEVDLLAQLAHDAVDAHAREALALEIEEELLVLALAPAHDRRQHEQPRARRLQQHAVHHLLHRLRGDHLAARRAVRHAHPREEHAQVVVDLGDGADGGARVLAGRLLLDRDRGRQPLDRVDLGLLHLLEELPRVGGERLDVAALALGVDGVEGERGLARAREPRQDDELVPGELHVDVLEVVLASTTHHDPIAGHGPPLWWSGGLLANSQEAPAAARRNTFTTSHAAGAAARTGTSRSEAAGPGRRAPSATSPAKTAAPATPPTTDAGHGPIRAPSAPARRGAPPAAPARPRPAASGVHRSPAGPL